MHLIRRCGRLATLIPLLMLPMPGTQVVDTARAAFGHGFEVTAAVSATIAVALAIAASVLLRHMQVAEGDSLDRQLPATPRMVDEFPRRR